VDFGTNQKCAWDFLLVLNSTLGAILPHFRVLQLLYDEGQFFHTHPLFWPKFWTPISVRKLECRSC